MKIIIAPDSFKGSLSAPEICKAIETGIRRVDKTIITESIPIADGGEGTVDVLIEATDGRKMYSTVTGPLGESVLAGWGVLGDGNTAVIEMSAASGLPLVSIDKRNPLNTTTFGTGQLIQAAVAAGCRKIITGIGGSATTDFGTGMAQALGVKFINRENRVITDHMNGRLMGEVSAIDMSGMDKIYSDCTFLAACDVTNPLLGKTGAVNVYSPQKGATPEICAELEHNMENISEITARTIKDVRHIPGAGAAGGLGGGLLAFLNASLCPGVELALTECGFEIRIRDADLIITGEGKIDNQTVFGKAISGVCKIAAKWQVPVIGIVGSLDADYFTLREIGLTSCFSICNKPMDFESAIKNTRDLITDTTSEIINVFLHQKRL